MYQFNIDPNSTFPKVKQIVRFIIMGIEKGEFAKNERLLSINEFNKKFKVARDTVEKAYNELKADGYITSVSGKGYYVLGKPDTRLKVLLVFNKLSSYKKIIYEAFVGTLGNAAKVDLHIHHYNPAMLKECLETHVGNYHYYVIMPHFYPHLKESDYLDIFKKIPTNQLMLLDKGIKGLSGLQMAVYQDFKNDIYQTLCSAADLLEKYQSLTIIFPTHRNYPTGTKDGVKQFCKENGKTFSIIPNIDKDELQPGKVYIVLAEADLAQLIKKVRKTSYQLGQDIGIISFNETVFKELLDITVVTTDFEAMGKTAANMILNKEMSNIRNPFKLIKRNSL